jgi:STE24 endopeptidase
MDGVFLLALPGLSYVAGRLAGALCRRSSDRVTAATRLRRSNRVLQATVAVLGLGLGVASPFDEALAAATPGPSGAGVLVVLAATVLGAGALPALAVHLGTRPAWRTIASDHVDYVGVLYRYVVGLALIVGPSFLVVGAWVLSPPGLLGVASVVVTALVVVALLPVVASWVAPTRRPTPAEATAIPACARGVHVRVVETGRHPVANALAAGLVPGARYVFVTDALFDVLDTEAAAAVVAHEVGHHARAHVLLRFAATGTALLPLFLVASGIFDALLPAVAASLVLLVAAGPIVRWTEFDADAYAAAHADPTAMERALETLADRGLIPVNHSLLVRLVALHPATGRRIDRLRERATVESDRYTGVETGQ